MELLDLNKFSNLHNGRNIVFCKTEYLEAEFKKIKKIKNEVVLISGNSDAGIDAKLASELPDNVLTWYCQNNLTHNEKIRSIPIGLENTTPNKRNKHGATWPHAVSKVQLLKKLSDDPSSHSPTKFLYANFNEHTNTAHRAPVKELCIKNPFITWDEPSLRYDDFISNVLDHEAVICPAGNGVDTHRLYEVLYCGRIAVTFKIGDYPLYQDLYEKLPVVILNNVNDLNDRDKLQEMVIAAKQKTYNLQLLDFNYWQQLIKNSANDITLAKASIFKKIFNY